MRLWLSSLLLVLPLAAQQNNLAFTARPCPSNISAPQVQMVIPILVGGISIPFVICANLDPSLVLDLTGATPVLKATTGAGTAVSCGSGLILLSGSCAVNTAVVQSVDNAEAGTDKYCASTNGNGSYTCALSNKALTHYSAGQLVMLSADVPCPAACTVNIDGNGVRAIKTNAAGATDAAVRPGLSLLGYDGTVFRLMTP